MRVMAIIGSFRKGGNTDLIVDQVLAGARQHIGDLEKIYVDDLQISSCEGCYECRREGRCRKDDDVAEVVRKIEASDLLVIGSPVYGSYMTGQLKVLLDRFMGVINKATYLGGRRKSVTRLQVKRRNILLVMVAGAPDEDCTESSLKLMRRMFDPMTNGGRLAELVATKLTARGQVGMAGTDLLQVARNMGYPDPEGVLEAMQEHNQAILERAYQLGLDLARQPETAEVVN